MMRNYKRYGLAIALILTITLISSVMPATAKVDKVQDVLFQKPLDLAGLEGELRDYISTRPGKINLYIEDLTTGQTLGLGEEEIHAAASTIKFPLILFIYERAAQGKIDLDTELTYTPEFYAQGTGILQGGPTGGQYTLRELSRLSLVYSDNIAWKMLLSYVGDETLYKYQKALGASAVGKVDGLYITSPKDMGIYLKRLLSFKEEHRELGEEILHYMQNTAFDEGIPYYLPEDKAVAHKMGALNDKFHDVGIVFGEHPFIITIFTDEAWEAVSLETLAQLSKMVYQHLESDTRG